MSSLNAQYLTYLAKYPLLTKSVTAGVLAALNETIASAIAGDAKGNRLGRIFNKKVLIMVFYGACLLTPTLHHLYATLNKVYRGPLSWKLKVAQMVTSLSTITPILLAMFTLWISLVNGYHLPTNKSFGEMSVSDIKQELVKVKNTIASGLRKNYWGVVKSSVLTSVCVLTIAQNFIKPELWVVFFNVVYFFLGTAQNTSMKIRSKERESLLLNKRQGLEEQDAVKQE